MLHSQHQPIDNPSAPAESPFLPYSSTKHRVTRGRYITSNDPRGYIPVYEYPLNGQWVMMDVDDGYVLWTGIWKALGNAKGSDIVKMIESQPELETQLRRVRGGYLKIQGTWMPYEVALRLARRVAWPIREDLIPLFGPTFPSTCLSPDQPGFGQVIDSTNRRRKRAPTQASIAKAAAAKEQQNASAAAAAAAYAQTVYPNHPHYRPTSPDYPGYSRSSFSRPVDPRGYSQRPYDQSSSYASEYSYSSHDQPRNGPSTSPGASRSQGVSGRSRYSPYPSGPPTPNEPGPYIPPHPSDPNRGIARGGFNLPPISAMGFEQRGIQPAGQDNGLPFQGSLPPITSLREGQTPSMDASSVLQRLRIDDTRERSGAPSSMVPGTGGWSSGVPAATPWGDRPSDEYMETRRRSYSAPSHPPFTPSTVGRTDDDRAIESYSSSATSAMRGGSQQQQNDSLGGTRPSTSYSREYYPGPQPQPPSQQQPGQHHFEPPSRNSSTTSAFWNSPSPSVNTNPSPVSPASSVTWSSAENQPGPSYRRYLPRHAPQQPQPLEASPRVSDPADVNVSGEDDLVASGAAIAPAPPAPVRAPMRPW